MISGQTETKKISFETSVQQHRVYNSENPNISVDSERIILFLLAIGLKIEVDYTWIHCKQHTERTFNEAYKIVQHCAIYKQITVIE